jgi:alkylation response protein AidB-like acyl-CoA dehydrogenase
MDFEPNETQRQIVEAAERLLDRHAGLDRARALVETASYDHQLHARLSEAGYLDLIAAEGTPLGAALVVEAVARHAGTVSAAG